MLDIDFVRQQFPVFAEPEGLRWAHFENAGGSYVPRQVTDKLIRFYTRTKVQPYGPWGPSREGGEAMDRSQRLLGETLNASADEIHFGPSTSQNTYVLAQALRTTFSEGDEVIVTNQDHEANIGVWWRLADQGLVIREWQVDGTSGLLDFSDLENLLSDRTRLVCVTHCSNIAATLNPVSEIARVVHAAGALLLVDGVSWAPHAKVDVKALDVDVYLYSLYKTYGPHLGLMYLRPELIDRLGHQGHYFNTRDAAYRVTPAGPNHAEIGAASGIVDYYDAVYRHHFGQSEATSLGDRIADVFELFGEREELLMTPLLDLLNRKHQVHVLGSREPRRAVRAPTIAFYSGRVSSAHIVEALVKAGIGCNHGHFYAYRLIKALGLEPEDGVVRLSALHYNTEAEIHRVCDVLEDTL